jgi:hypothetical protein
MLQQPRSQEETPCTRTQEVSWEITRRNTMHKNTRSILGNPSQQGKKTQPNPLLYSSRERLSPPRKPSTQEGVANPRRLAPKRGAHFSQVDVLAEISEHTHKRYDSSMGNLPLLILDLTCQQKCLLAQQGRPLYLII